MPAEPEPEGPTEMEIALANSAAFQLQAKMKRMLVSETIEDIMEFCQDNFYTDHALNPDYPPRKDNKWVEQKKCVIL